MYLAINTLSMGRLLALSSVWFISSQETTMHPIPGKDAQWLALCKHLPSRFWLP
jgi:hypothetical protein